MIVHNVTEFGSLGPEQDGLALVDPRLATFVRSPNSGVFYSPSTRVFKIALLRWSLRKSWQQQWNSILAIGFDIYYCPFSGRILPGALRSRKWRVIKEQLGLRRVSAFEVDRRIPREFNTSEWWIQRGIQARMRPTFNKHNWVEGKYTFPKRNFPKSYPRYSYSRFQEHPPHLCRDLGEMFSHAGFSIAYIPYTREYGIRIHGDIHEPNHYRPLRMRKIDFCPSCGTKFPPSLKARWQEEIRKSGRGPNDDGLPDKYLSDIWWKELGL